MCTVSGRVANRSSIGLEAPHRHIVSASDELFFALEGETVEAQGDYWSIEVCGIHSAGSRHWVQLQLRGPSVQGITIRVSMLDAHQVVTVIREWLEGLLPSTLDSAVTASSYFAAPTN
jgi:hypothetical protein